MRPQTVQVVFAQRRRPKTVRVRVMRNRKAVVMEYSQTVQVAFPVGQRRYTYRYMFDPAAGRAALAVGDVVEVPANEVSPDGDGTAVVVALGSDYCGPMKTIVRLVAPDEMPLPAPAPPRQRQRDPYSPGAQ